MNSSDVEQYDAFMAEAIIWAERAASFGEVPVGAVIVRGGEVIAGAGNRSVEGCDPTAHAEILAIRAAALVLGDWRLGGCTMVVTLEPCCMCAGAIVLARMDRLIYGAADPKAGAVKTLYQLCEDKRLNHTLEVAGGLRADECGQLLTDFFRKQRAMGKK